MVFVAMFVTYIGVAVAVLMSFAAMFLTTSAPQQAALAATAMCAAVIPYVLLRTLQIARQIDLEEDRHKALIKAIEGLNRP